MTRDQVSARRLFLRIRRPLSATLERVIEIIPGNWAFSRMLCRVVAPSNAISPNGEREESSDDVTMEHMKAAVE